MKQKFLNLYKKYGKKALVAIVVWQCVKWSIILYFGKYIVEYFSR